MANELGRGLASKIPDTTGNLMKSLRLIAVSALALATFAAPVLAATHKKAASTSHHLAESSAAIHDYLHHTYGSSFGAHGMETAADVAHGTLHDYDHGEASESDVLTSVADANAAFTSTEAQMVAAGVIKGPGQDQEAKKLFDEVHKTLAKLNAFTN